MMSPREHLLIKKHAKKDEVPGQSSTQRKRVRNQTEKEGQASRMKNSSYIGAKDLIFIDFLK